MGLLPRLKDLTLSGILTALAILGPVVAYAGVSIIHPSSTKTLDIDTSPPVTFDAGADYPLARSAGFVGDFTGQHNNASYTMTIFGLSGGNVTIDNLTVLSADAAVDSYRVQIATAMTGTLSFDDLRIRMWDPALDDNPPAGDQATNACAVLDLTAAANTESTGACTASTIHMQLVYDLDGTEYTTQSGSVSVRPSGITFTS